MDKRRTAARCALGVGFFALGLLGWTATSGAAELDGLAVDAATTVVDKAGDALDTAEDVDLADPVGSVDAIVSAVASSEPLPAPEVPVAVVRPAFVRAAAPATIPAPTVIPADVPSAAAEPTAPPVDAAPAAPPSTVAGALLGDDATALDTARAPAPVELPRHGEDPADPVEPLAANRPSNGSDPSTRPRPSTGAATAHGDDRYAPSLIGALAPGATALDDAPDDRAHPTRGPPEKDTP